MAYVTKHPELAEEERVRVICNPEEFEYLMMGLHAFTLHNLQNVDKMKGEELANEVNGELIKLNVNDEVFIPQHVAVQKLIDQLSEGYGYDPAVEG